MNALMEVLKRIHTALSDDYTFEFNVEAYTDATSGICIRVNWFDRINLHFVRCYSCQEIKQANIDLIDGYIATAKEQINLYKKTARDLIDPDSKDVLYFQ